MVLLLEGLLITQNLCADGPIIPVEAIAIGGLFILAAAMLYAYVMAVLVFRVLNKRKGLRKNNKRSSVVLGVVFIILAILGTHRLNIIILLIAGFGGAWLGYFPAPDPDALTEDPEQENEQEAS